MDYSVTFQKCFCFTKSSIEIEGTSYLGIENDGSSEVITENHQFEVLSAVHGSSKFILKMPVLSSLELDMRPLMMEEYEPHFIQRILSNLGTKSKDPWHHIKNHLTAFNITKWIGGQCSTPKQFFDQQYDQRLLFSGGNDYL